MFHNFFSGAHRASRPSGSRAAMRPRRYAPRVESLEERNLLSFLPAVSYPSGLDPYAVKTASLRNNGITDIVAANGNSDTVSVFLGNGDGTFRPKVDYATSGSPDGILLADLTGDGTLDIVTSNFDGNNVSVLIGNGDGTFQTHQDFAAGAGGSSVVLGDFNGDGVPDLVTADYFDNTVSVLLGNGDGSFQAPIHYATPAGPVTVVVADFNGDGSDDVAVATQGAAPDFQGRVSVFLNNNGVFAPRVDYLAGLRSDDVAVGDFNNDGQPDLVVPNSLSNSVSVFLGNPDGTFQAALNSPLAGKPTQVAVADFDQRDGNADVAITLQQTNQVAVLLGNGDGTFGDPALFAVGNHPIAIATGDFNGDGYPDVVTTNSNGNDISVLINDADWGSAPRPGDKGSQGQVPPTETSAADATQPADPARTATDGLFADASAWNWLSANDDFLGLTGVTHHRLTHPGDGFPEIGTAALDDLRV